MQNLSDTELVASARGGSREAYGALVTRYQGHVYGLAYSLVNNWVEAQDIAQETFIRAFVNLDQLREPAKFAAWLRRVTFGVAMNWLKAFRPGLFKQLGHPDDPDHLGLPDFAPGPAEILEKRDLARAVLQAVASLPPKYRVPLTMFHLDGLSYQKVADFLEIPLNTAKSLIHRAREMLRPALLAHAEEEVTPMVKEVFDEHKLPPEFARKVIAGLEKARWGGGMKENSVIAVLATAMQAVGEDISYEFLMGVSGAAFRVQMMYPIWCPSAPHAACGFSCVAPAEEALPYEMVGYEPKEADAASITTARQAIVDSIDRGIPVRFADYEESLIVGYEDGGNVLLLRPYATSQAGYVPMQKWPWVIGVLKKRAAPPDRTACIARSLRRAVEMASAGQLENKGKPGRGYYCGFAALDYWMAGLRDDAWYTQASADDVKGRRHANAHCWCCLVDAREAAVKYLDLIEPELDTQPAGHVSRVRESYRQELTLLAERPPWDLAPWPFGPWASKPWSDDLRHMQADVIAALIPLEHAAVTELGSAAHSWRPD